MIIINSSFPFDFPFIPGLDRSSRSATPIIMFDFESLFSISSSIMEIRLLNDFLVHRNSIPHDRLLINAIWSGKFIDISWNEVHLLRILLHTYFFIEYRRTESLWLVILPKRIDGINIVVFRIIMLEFHVWNWNVNWISLLGLGIMDVWNKNFSHVWQSSVQRHVEGIKNVYQV
jgi:hypothetical protein